MELNKYPVTFNEMEYYVSICDTPYGCYEVILYSKYEGWNTFKKWKKLWTLCTYSKSEWNGKYIEIATNIVRRYDKWLDEFYTQKEEREAGRKQWEEWDGRIR